MCSPDPAFMQLVGLALVPMIQGKDLEVLDVDALAKKAVEIALAVAREVEAIMKEEDHGGN